MSYAHPMLARSRVERRSTVRHEYNAKLGRRPLPPKEAVSPSFRRSQFKLEPYSNDIRKIISDDVIRDYIGVVAPTLIEPGDVVKLCGHEYRVETVEGQTLTVRSPDNVALSAPSDASFEINRPAVPPPAAPVTSKDLMEVFMKVQEELVVKTLGRSDKTMKVLNDLPPAPVSEPVWQSNPGNVKAPLLPPPPPLAVPENYSFKPMSFYASSLSPIRPFLPIKGV